MELFNWLFSITCHNHLKPITFDKYNCRNKVTRMSWMLVTRVTDFKDQTFLYGSQYQLTENEVKLNWLL